VTNYRNPPALDREPRFLNVVANTYGCTVEMRFCTDRWGYGICTLILGHYVTFVIGLV